MRIKLVGGLITFLLLVLSLLLFIKDDSNLEIITSPKIYSLYKSSEFESFNVPILTNDATNYFFKEDYIAKIALTADNDEIIPLTVKEIVKTNNLYNYADKKYYYLTFKLQIAFNSDDYNIVMNKAYLKITYKNAKEIKLYIGEVNYLFSSEENYDISLNNLLSTHGIVNNKDTSTGLFLNLGNLSNNNLIISKIEIGSNNIVANNAYLREIENLPNYDASPETILGMISYDYHAIPKETAQQILLRKNNEIMLYVPFAYLGDIGYLYRFYVKVYYYDEGTLKVFIIDDFPYINTTSFKQELSQDFYYYEFSN